MSRRSFFVGRPAPRSRWGSPRAGAAGRSGVWSVKQWEAASAPTLFAMSLRTSRMRSNPGCRTRIVSPTITDCDALTGLPLIRTCPARQAVVAAERVLYARIAQSQASMRTLAVFVAWAEGGGLDMIANDYSRRAASSVVRKAGYRRRSSAYSRWGTTEPASRSRKLVPGATISSMASSTASLRTTSAALR